MFFNYGIQGWREGRKEETFGTRGGSLTINGASIPAQQIYVRGGPHPRDPLFLHGEPFKGAIKITVDKTSLFAVNVIAMEDYLRGVLPAEMSASWNLEALKAQAVASRSYTFYMHAHPRSPLYDVERGTKDQVYGGLKLETLQSNLAVDETEGEYLSFKEKPIKAYFHSRCGGSTETEKSVWSGNSKLYQLRIHCPYCVKNPLPWQFQITLSRLFKLLGFPGLAQKFHLNAWKKSPSGRIEILKLQSEQNEEIISSDHFRSRIGYQHIKSSRFNWSIMGENIIFRGVGLGHGVGMCQWGARELAKEGKDYRHILSYFYPGTELMRPSETHRLAELVH